MLYFQLINIFILLGLINYSYEFNIENAINYLARHIRDTDFKSDTQVLLNKIFEDQKILEDKIKESIRNDDDTIRSVTRTILSAANKMAQAGSKDIRSVEQWTTIKSELHRGINVIIGAYRRYINLHQEVFETIENFTQNMIVKYEDELSMIDQMTVPTLVNNTIDTNSLDWNAFVKKFIRMLNYANVHQQTLRTATDCTADLMTHTLAHRATVVNQPVSGVRTIRIHINHPAVSEYNRESFDIPCNNEGEYNGYERCSSAIADATQSYANAICSG